MSNLNTAMASEAMIASVEVQQPQAVHTVIDYTKGKTVALDGQRLDVVFWKTDDKGIKRDSKCVSVPMIDSTVVASNLTALMPHLISYLETVQHDIIKERVTANASHITDEEISVTSCIQYLNESTKGADGKSAHLTKESVATWFDSVVADNLMVALADKLGIGNEPDAEQLVKLDTAIKMYKDKVTALAGGTTKYPAPMARSLKNAMSLVASDDPIAAKFVVRLDKMIAAESDMFMAL